MEIVLLIIRLVLFGVFAVSGISKVLDPEGTAKAMREFGTPNEFSRFFSVALPFAELVFAACFLFVSMSWVGSAGALLLLATFTGGMIWQMRLGRAPDCHCFGQIHSEPVGTKSIIRNLIFALLAAILFFQGRDGQGAELSATASGMLQMVLILLLVTIAVVLLGYLVKLTAQQNEIIRRIGVLELASGDLKPVVRNDAGDPSDGLPIGAPIPDFAIPDINGRIFTPLQMLADKRPHLLLFVGPECAPCELLLPDIREWESQFAGKLDIVFVSHGSVDANRKKFGTDRKVLVEKERGLANAVNAKWTPTAIFVGADGNIASHIAAGDVAIRRLAEQIKTRELSDEFVYFLGMNGARRPNIGQKVPEFSVLDINGREITERDLAGKQTLVAFTSPTCGHCLELMKEIREWEKNKGTNDPSIIIFTDGDEVEEQKAGIMAPMIIDKEYQTAAGFGMRGVPSAVLINENGIIVTEAAIGSRNIWSLIGGRGSKETG